MSWRDVIDWLQDAFKAQIINEEQYNKVKMEYHQVSLNMNANPRQFIQQQLQMRNMGQYGNMPTHTQQQLVNQMQQARQLPGQKAGIQQPLQTAQQTMPPQVQMNMSGLPQMPQQMPPQPQAPPLQPQLSQQQQQQLSQQQQQQVQQQQQQQQQVQAAQQQQAPTAQQQQIQTAQQRKARTPARKGPVKKGQDVTNPMVIGNTPTPTNVPTPSPAQHAASLPTTTPMNVASPAGLHFPGSTPQGISISPTDSNNPFRSEQMSFPFTFQEQQAAIAFTKAEMEKQKMLMAATWANRPVKNLSQEEKDQMRALLTNQQTQEYISRIDRLAPWMLLISKSEEQTINFLRLV